MNYYTVHCISLAGDCIVTIQHLRADSPDDAMKLAEEYFPVDAQSVEEWGPVDDDFKE